MLYLKMKKRRNQLSPVEPDVLNTLFIFLALSDDFQIAAENAGFKTFQDLLDNRERALDGSIFNPAHEMELFEYAEFHGFIHLLGLE